jgi:hypothetical protein
MADDNIVDIAFTDVTIIENVVGNKFVASVSGTLVVNYTAQTITNCALTASGTGFPTTTFTAATLGPPEHEQFTVQATSGLNNTLQFTYTGFQPDNLFFLELTLGSFSPSFIGPPFFNNTLTSTFVCFVEGTLIRMPGGDVPVETLKIGDLVVTSSGKRRAVKWVGHRKMNCRAHPNPFGVFPVRIAQGAFGPGRPSQDLYLSSGHSVCVDLCGEVLIPIGNLVNGATIAQIEVDEVTYWHVELDSHDVLIANNLPAESYLAMGNRGFFEERRGLLPAMLEGSERTHADFCRPVVTDGPVLDFVRQRLRERAEAIGWTPLRETDLHLVVDGKVHRPLSEGDAAVFLFPASASEVWLKSNTFIPALVGGGDPRPLGVSLSGLVFFGGRGEARSVHLDDERLQDGLNPEEGRDGVAWRWTKGELALSPDFWEGLSGHVALHLTCNNNATRRWVSPGKAQTEIPSDKSARPQIACRVTTGRPWGRQDRERAPGSQYRARSALRTAFKRFSLQTPSDPRPRGGREFTRIGFSNSVTRSWSPGAGFRAVLAPAAQLPAPKSEPLSIGTRLWYHDTTQLPVKCRQHFRTICSRSAPRGCAPAAP